MNHHQYKLLIGLGNPGKEYENTYHNIGFLFIDYLANKTNFKNYHNFKYAKMANLILAKPLTFMNESGLAVISALKRFKIKTNELLIIHDDSDLSLGKYKISINRGSAGHKGVDSIIKTLQTKEFARLRIGSRSRPLKVKALDFVLKRITRQDRRLLDSTFAKIKKELGYSSSD
jgi:PTH1 family peptidyl-tRNA hydrolase